MATARTTSRDGLRLAPEWRIGTYEWWPTADRLTWSPELVRIYGLETAPSAEQGFSALVHPGDRVRVEGETSTFLGSGAEGFSHSFRIVRPDGSVRVILDRGAIERDAAGNARVVHGVNIDVTDEAPFGASGRERDGAASEAKTRTLDRGTQLDLAMEAALAIAFEWDIRTDRVWRVLSDDLLLPVTADQPDTFEAVAAAVHPDDRAAFRASVEAAMKSADGKYSSEHRIVRPDGAERWLAESGLMEFGEDGTPVRLIGISHDITGRKRTEQELAEANALLEALFQSAPVGLGVWDADFRFLRINPELAAINGLPPEDHIGRRPDEILPGIANIDEVYRNWQRMLETGEPWREVEISGETPAEPGRQRHWQEDFFPVRVGGRNLGIAAIVQETSRRKAAEEGLRASESRWRMLFEAIDEGFCVVEMCLDAPDGRIDYRVVEANPAFYEQTGFPEAIFNQWLREAAPDLEEHWYEIYGSVARTGEPRRFEENSEMLGRWFDVYAFRVDAPQDRRVAILFKNISERKRHEEQTRLLLHEINHRSKNILGLAQAIARQTAASSAENFVETFGERMRSLAAAQDLLVNHDWKSVPVEDLVRSQLGHFSDLMGERIEIDGPLLPVTPGATQALGMALHELATNAAKYGALSDEAGRVGIGWAVETEASTEPRFCLTWLERNGPPVAEPERRGFGSRVTTTMVEASTGGEVTVEYAPQGLRWRLSCPAASVLDAAGVEGGREDRRVPRRRSARSRASGCSLSRTNP